MPESYFLAFTVNKLDMTITPTNEGPILRDIVIEGCNFVLTRRIYSWHFEPNCQLQQVKKHAIIRSIMSSELQCYIEIQAIRSSTCAWFNPALIDLSLREVGVHLPKLPPLFPNSGNRVLFVGFRCAKR